MSIVQTTERDRREIIVNRLIARQMYTKGDKHLEVISTAELEKQYDLVSIAAHPHDGAGSIRFLKS